MAEENINKTVVVNGDSLEFGTPGKLGTIKCYGDFNNENDFKEKIDKAIELREYANVQVQIKLGSKD
ncbi:MAG: hypothetical protein ACTSU7_00070 [Candidatus Heimdallarchaeaceae archaeon]